MSSHLIYLGTSNKLGFHTEASYPSEPAMSKGIYAIHLDDDTGALSAPQLVAETPNPEWVTLSPDKKFLYTTYESSEQAIGFRVDGTSGKLTPLGPRRGGPGEHGPSHLAVDATGRTLLAANSVDGYVAALPIRLDGTLGPPIRTRHAGRGPNPLRQDRPHPHSVTLSPNNSFVIVCDLGLDKIFTYLLDPATAKLTPAKEPVLDVYPGTGPRHFVFSPNGHYGYCITEMGATVIPLFYQSGRLGLTATDVSTVPKFYEARWAAEVHVHPNGRFLYASNRGHDTIAVFEIESGSAALSIVERTPSGGKAPCSFALSPDGKWLVCGHQYSEEITVFRVDSTSGRLTKTPHTANVSRCVCVLFYD